MHWPPLSARRYTWQSCLLEAESTPGLSVAGRIKPMDISNDPFGNRTRDLPACRACLNQKRHRVLKMKHTYVVRNLSSDCHTKLSLQQLICVCDILTVQGLQTGRTAAFIRELPWQTPLNTAHRFTHNYL
jgi:hypothetical protein